MIADLGVFSSTLTAWIALNFCGATLGSLVADAVLAAVVAWLLPASGILLCTLGVVALVYLVFSKPDEEAKPAESP
jgi:hypothetical protein